jgi:hypothetical protein
MIISPIQVSPNGRHFVDRNGTPVFWLGDTLWELFRLFPEDQALQLLKDRQAQGFNVILIMLTGVDFTRLEGWAGRPFTNLAGAAPWIEGDPLRPNEAYFRDVDRMIRLGEQTGQTFVVGVYHQWHKEVITLEKARPWARWVAQRYRDVPNLIWSMYPRATDEFVPVCRELAAGLQEGDGGAHLISVHPDPSVASSSFIHNEPWLAFNMIQTCIDYDRIHPAVSADYRRTPVKPVVMAEGGYEGVEFDRLQTAHHIRKQAWWTQLAGGYHVYGHNDAWMAPQDWQRWSAAEGARCLGVFREILTSLDRWWDLVPDQSLFLSGEGSGFAWNAASRQAWGDWILVYLSEPSTVTVRLDVLSPGRRGTAGWIDPRNGERVPAVEYAAGEAPVFTTPPGWEDALLLVEV